MIIDQKHKNAYVLNKTVKLIKYMKYVGRRIHYKYSQKCHRIQITIKKTFPPLMMLVTNRQINLQKSP